MYAIRSYYDHRTAGGAGGGEGAVTDPLGRLSAALADRYRIERELGQGGMTTVYVAYDLRHDRKVALKLRNNFV